MKRKNNLFQNIISIDSLNTADVNARKNNSKRRKQHEVMIHDQNREQNILELHNSLKDKSYKTSKYVTFLVREPKEREVSKLPYYPCRIVHQALIDGIGQYLIDMFTADTYSCIKGKGIHAANDALEKAMKDIPGTKYCLKLDVKKFYPSIDHNILKAQLRRKFKDRDLLWLMDEIIDSAPGLPIGNLTSQYFANFYLAYFDHWIKQDKAVKYYFRYLDDIVILSDNKEYLHELLAEIKEYMDVKLHLTIKQNYQIFPVAKRGIDFVGYVRFHRYCLLRKTIKKSFARMLKRNSNWASIASYYGWAIHCDSKNLLTKLLTHAQLQRLQYTTAKRRFRRFSKKNNRGNEYSSYHLQIRNKTIQNKGQLSLFAG